MSDSVCFGDKLNFSLGMGLVPCLPTILEFSLMRMRDAGCGGLAKELGWWWGPPCRRASVPAVA